MLRRGRNITDQAGQVDHVPEFDIDILAFLTSQDLSLGI